MAEFSNVKDELMSHQKECALRYEGIQKQLESGERRFDKIEKLVWGLYLLIITSTILPNFF